ncbi:NIF system FeS cluster assembly, NifU, C-terminal [Artemisia annua]|uniref:NIF system FeS cluster assembly, NifU, C-terminal n=1 Tax=Artemisia annua TaxID=35608 RepID=A0A2U1MMT7_ARTAN|nr:NIF system FeS cluster assembly, NifU, C-terminal [Artemisia annua]
MVVSLPDYSLSTLLPPETAAVYESLCYLETMECGKSRSAVERREIMEVMMNGHEDESRILDNFSRDQVATFRRDHRIKEVVVVIENKYESGACGTSPSSTTTMKMGIERVLKETFGDAVKDVDQVYDEQPAETTVEARFLLKFIAVNGLLEILRPKLWWKCGGIIRSRWGMHCEVYRA